MSRPPQAKAFSRAGHSHAGRTNIRLRQSSFRAMRKYRLSQTTGIYAKVYEVNFICIYIYIKVCVFCSRAVRQEKTFYFEVDRETSMEKKTVSSTNFDVQFLYPLYLFFFCSFQLRRIERKKNRVNIQLIFNFRQWIFFCIRF